jgi:hypothetical protein
MNVPEALEAMEQKKRVDFLPSKTKRVCNKNETDLMGHFIEKVEPAGHIFRVAMCTLNSVDHWVMLADVHVRKKP